MPAEERRAAIIEATRPLVLQLGADVTTKQIAEACGLAEGTLFRVFPNKDAIVHAVVDDLLDPKVLVARIDGIDRSVPLPTQIRQAIELLYEANRQVVGVMTVLHPKRGEGEKAAEPKHRAHQDGEKAVWAERKEAPARAMAALLDPHAAELIVDVPIAIAFIRGTVLAATHPLTGAEGLNSATLTSLICRALIKEQ